MSVTMGSLCQWPWAYVSDHGFMSVTMCLCQWPQVYVRDHWATIIYNTDTVTVSVHAYIHTLTGKCLSPMAMAVIRCRLRPTYNKLLYRIGWRESYIFRNMIRDILWYRNNDLVSDCGLVRDSDRVSDRGLGLVSNYDLVIEPGVVSVSVAWLQSMGYREI